MKKLYFFLIASLLVLGLTQCKKDNPTGEEGEKVSITLILDETPKADGAKSDITLNEYWAPIKYVNGDEIVVGYDGKYVGTLSYNSGKFTGSLDITTPNGDQPLHFYFLGNRQGDISANATSCAVSISDQSSSYPVLSYAASNENYSGAGTYTAYLLNQCGLVRFQLSTEIPFSKTVVLKNWVNKVKVDFSTNTIIPGGDNNNEYPLGDIILHAETEIDRWAVLPVWGSGNSYITATDFAESVLFEIPEVSPNDYLNVGVNVEPMSDFFFSVSENQKVSFAPGNLQATYDGSTWTWAFAEHQWDIIGDGPANTTITGSGTISGTGTVDLFQWSTDCVNSFYGINDLNPENVWVNENNTLTFYNFVDWGNLNIGTYPANTWRTLSGDEWNYLLDNSARGTKRFLKAKITVGDNSYHGLIIFPDMYSGKNLTGTYTFNYQDHLNPVWAEVSAQDWNVMQEAGAAFLPCAGYRNNIYHSENETMVMEVYSVDEHGVYHASEYPGSYSGECADIWFDDSHLYVPTGAHLDCDREGKSVRLVRNVSGGAVSNAVVITNRTVSGITQNTAVCGGEVITDGGIAVTARGLCWSTQPNPTPLPIIGSESGFIQAGEGTGSFTSTMSGLSAGTTYYVRAYALNSAGNYSYGNEVRFTTLAEGVVDHVFTIDNRGTTVHFAPGNLQYNQGHWKFADHQYEYLGTWTNNGPIDLFSLGTWTSGGEDPYYLTSYYSNEYTMPYNDFRGSIIGQYYNWFTLDKSQWIYVTNLSNYPQYRRVTVDGVAKNPWGYATVMETPGLILLPDDWDGSVDPNFDYGATSYSSNQYTSFTYVKWSAMEAAGVVFLPNAGYRESGSTVTAGSAYWCSATAAASTAPSIFNQQFVDGKDRKNGFSVRLVR